jgi:hypothetical protein
MINNISWASYWYAIALTLISYYLFILIVFYKRDIQYFIGGNKRQPTPDYLRSTLKQQDKIGKESLSGIHDEEGLISAAQALNDEAIAYLEQAGLNGSIKDEIVYCLQQIIKKFPILKYTAHQPAINKLIQSECTNNCSLSLDEQDINNVWLG